MVEAAVPTILFTVLWLTTKELQHRARSSASRRAVVLLVVRLVQRSTVQFVVNALVGIGIGWLFVTMSARSGGSADDQALAYFLPGILYNAGYSVVLAFTCLIGWPLVGFMVGSVTGDPTAWHQDRQVVRLCALADLGAGRAVHPAGGRPGARSGSPASPGRWTPTPPWRCWACSRSRMGWPLQLAALAGDGVAAGPQPHARCEPPSPLA